MCCVVVCVVCVVLLYVLYVLYVLCCCMCCMCCVVVCVVCVVLLYVLYVLYVLYGSVLLSPVSEGRILAQLQEESKGFDNVLALTLPCTSQSDPHYTI